MESLEDEDVVEMRWFGKSWSTLLPSSSSSSSTLVSYLSSSSFSSFRKQSAVESTSDSLERISFRKSERTQTHEETGGSELKINLCYMKQTCCVNFTKVVVLPSTRVTFGEGQREGFNRTYREEVKLELKKNLSLSATVWK